MYIHNNNKKNRYECVWKRWMGRVVAIKWENDDDKPMINQWIEWDTIFSDCPKWLIFGQGTWVKFGELCDDATTQENHGRIKLERPQKQCNSVTRNLEPIVVDPPHNFSAKRCSFHMPSRSNESCICPPTLSRDLNPSSYSQLSTPQTQTQQSMYSTL